MLFNNSSNLGAISSKTSVVIGFFKLPISNSLKKDSEPPALQSFFFIF